LDEAALRGQIRQELEAREKRRQHLLRREEEENRRRDEARLRAKILAEEEEKFYTSRGFVRYVNRQGQAEWLTPEEAELRAKGRRKEFVGAITRGGRLPRSRHDLPKRLVYALLGAMTLVALTAVALSLLKAQPRLGNLEVLSDPPGARVWVDGADTGKATPCQLTGLREGLHVVVVTRPGFEARPPVQAAQVQAQQGTAIKFDLASNVQLATAKITANLEPDAYTLYVDGYRTELPETGELSLPVGYHVLTPVKKGHSAQPRFRRIFVQPDKKAVAAEFEFTPTNAPLGLITTPASPLAGYLYVNGQFTGLRGGGGAWPVPPGEHRVQMPGRELLAAPGELKVAVAAGGTAPPQVPGFGFERALLLTARVGVRTPAPGAGIVLDGEWLPHVTPLPDLELTPGQHYLNLYRDGQWLAAEDVPFVAEAGKPQELTFEF
jgi:hypothetical protein